MIDSNNIHDLAAPNEDMRKIIAKETQRINDSLNNPSNMRDLVIFECQTMLLDMPKDNTYAGEDWSNLNNKDLLKYYRQLVAQYYEYYDKID